MAPENIDLNEKSLLSLVRLFRRFSTRVYTKEIKALEETLTNKSNNLLLLVKELTIYSNAEMLGFLTEEIKTKANELEKLALELKEKFLIFVVGMGKYGKSTLVNALAGSKVAEVDILPKTWKIDIYEESYSNQAIIRYLSGETEIVSLEKAKQIVKEEEDKRLETEKLVTSEFHKMLPYLDNLQEKEELKKALAKKHLYISNITEVKWPCQSSPFLAKFRIVDTPGLYQDTPGLENKEDIRQYYHKAHGVLWLLDATKISAQSSKQMLDELNAALKKVSSKPQNIIGVLNRIDLIETEGDDPVRRVLQEAETLFKGTFRSLVPLSAKMAERGVLKNDANLIEKSGLTALYNEIEDLFLAQASACKYQSAVDGLKLIQSSLLQTIKEYLKRLKKDYNHYKELQTQTDQALFKLQESFSEELRVILTNYKKDIKANIGKNAEILLQPNNKTKVKEKILREAIFRESYFISQLNSFQYRSIEALERTGRLLIKKSVFREFENLSLKSVLLVYKQIQPEDKLAVSSFTGDEEFALASVLTFAASGLLLGPLGLVITGVTGLTGLLRQAYVNFYQLPKLRSELERYLDLVVKKAEEELTKSLADGLETIAKQINHIRTETYTFLHGPFEKTDEVIIVLEKLVELLNEDMSVVVDLKSTILGGEVR